MTSARQKTDEQVHFELFKELLNECPMRLPRHDDNPDFLVEREGRTIGIEHAEFYRRRTPSSKRPYDPAELEGIQQGIVRKARELYMEEANPPVSVKVWFDPGMKRTPLAGGRPKTIAAELSQFVAAWACTDPSPYADFGVGGADTTPIAEITILGITRAGSTWSKENPSLVGPASVSELQRTIDEKGTKYDVYRQKCDECWLLIAANRFNPAQGTDFSRDDSSLRHSYKSRFDRIFFLEFGHRELFELNHAIPNDTSERIE
jgi:hypothetical protein